jgi:hypothetical protein
MGAFGGSGQQSSGGSSNSGGAGWAGAASGVLGMLGGIGQANRQYHRQKKLMGFQHDYQRMLNQQGHDLQMDMWNKTNYKAQVEHMKKAGLNPGLMYGQAGQGGTTGSQGGGSAAGGSAAGERVMDLQNALLGAQIEKLGAETRTEDERANDLRSQIERRDGYEKTESGQRVLESKENIKNLGIARDEMNSRIVLNEVDGELKRSGISLNEEQERQIDAMIRKINVDTEMQKKILEMDYSDEVGKNWMVNAEKLFGGEFDTGTYAGAAATIAGIAALRNPAVIGNMLRSATKVKGFDANRAKGGLKKMYDEAVKWFKNKFKN